MSDYYTLAIAAECHRVGISGNCGLDCPVLIRGECESEGMAEELELSKETDNERGGPASGDG